MSENSNGAAKRKDLELGAEDRGTSVRSLGLPEIYFLDQENENGSTSDTSMQFLLMQI